MSDQEPGAAGKHRGPGRPRRTQSEDRVLAAVNELIASGTEVTVRSVVEASGVSRGSIYRRWPGIIDLVAAALDHGREPYRLPRGGSLLDSVLHSLSGDQEALPGQYSEDRLRTRLRLSLSDQRLQRTYWEAHVARRREGLVALLREGIASGELREDLDIESSIDLISGVSYYQIVVRGESLQSPGTRERVREAVRIAWRGMLR